MVTKEKVKQYYDRLKTLDDEKRTLNEDVKELMAEAKDEAGLDPKVLRKMLSRRRKSRTELEQEETLLSEYEAAILE